MSHNMSHICWAKVSVYDVEPDGICENCSSGAWHAVLHSQSFFVFELHFKSDPQVNVRPPFTDLQ